MRSSDLRTVPFAVALQPAEDAPCHVAGGRAVFGAIRTVLGLEPGQTSADGKWTFEMTSCIGGCGVAPMPVAEILTKTADSKPLTAGELGRG